MKTLLLDKMYQPIAFITFRPVVRLVYKDKVDVLSVWNEEPFINGDNYPSVIRLKEYIRKKPRVPRFNRRGIFRRDLLTCQYTGRRYPPSKLTVDHVIPKSQGGKSTWENCVTSSLEANARKGDRTPAQAGMRLLAKPAVPTQALATEYVLTLPTHPDWQMYFPESMVIEH